MTIKMRISWDKHKVLLLILASLVLVIVSSLIAYFFLFNPPQKTAEVELFTTPISTVDKENVVKKLKDGGYIRNSWAFNLALARTGNQVEPGGYKISKSMDAWELAKTLTSTPSLKWVVIPEGLRKEEVGERLAKALGWDEKQLHDWTYTYTAMGYDHLEGVYFPDTYLIPVEENGLDVANRLRRRFDEQFAPYMTKFLKQDVKWTTALKIASIV